MKEILILVLVLAVFVVCFGGGFLTEEILATKQKYYYILVGFLYLVGLLAIGLFVKAIFNLADKDRERGNELAICNKKDILMKTHGNKLVFFTPKQTKKSLTSK